jgi:Protein of unknown function DUF72
MIRIGTCGWSYDRWQPELYAPGLPAAGRLACCAAAFPRPSSTAASTAGPGPRRSPAGGAGCLMASACRSRHPRGLTHSRRLYAPQVWIGRITAGWHELGDKRAVLLVQLAPTHVRGDARLAYFLQQIPSGIWLSAEFRHPSWHCEDVFALRLLRDERRTPAMRPARHHRFCLRANAWPRSPPPVRRLVQRHRFKMVGGPDRRMGRGRQRRVRLFQQLRQRQRGAERADSPDCARPVDPVPP